MKNIAIYYRVSTDKQELESQKHVIEKWIEGLKEKPDKIYVFKDEGISGASQKRKGYQRLMDFAYRGKIDTIVVYRLDRFSRDASSAIRVILDLDQHGVAFISATQPALNLGHENPFRRTMIAAFAEIAEIERTTIVARIKDGIEAAKKKGVKFGAPLKTTPEMQKRALQMRKDRMTYKNIAKTLGVSLSTAFNLVADPDYFSKNP